MEEAEISAALDRACAARRPELDVLDPTPAPSPRRLGLVPGSFDPMTVAHAALAEALHEHGCDLVVLVYSPRTLGKEDHAGRAPAPPLLPPTTRVASLLSFSRPRPWAGVGIASHGLLLDQAEAAARRFPGVRITIGVGSDKLVQLFDPGWYEDRDAALERLFAVAEVAYAVRAGDEAAVTRTLRSAPAPSRRLLRVGLPESVSRVSSRLVREMIARGERPFELVPPEVHPFLVEA